MTSRMNILESDFPNRVEKAVGEHFTVVTKSSSTFYFENLKFKGHNFYLRCDWLEENDVLEVAKILKEVFSNFPSFPRIFSNHHDLNLNSVFSSQYLKAVIALEGSSLHKLLLLTSGSHLLWRIDPDKAIAMAKAKIEMCGKSEDLAINSTVFRNLKDLYVLPGIAPSVVKYGTFPAINSLGADAIEKTAQLMAFLSNSSEIPFNQYQKLDFTESITTARKLPFMGEIDSLYRLMKTHYRALAESLPARSLSALGSFITRSVRECRFPERILTNRASALASTSFSPENDLENSILIFLSDEERSSIVLKDSYEEIGFTDFDYLITKHTVFTATPQVIYAAFAEFVAVKGVDEAFEAAREMKHLQAPTEFNPRVYEATLALIEEYLTSEDSEMPFSWFAQMSEHSWVLTSHEESEKLTIV